MISSLEVLSKSFSNQQIPWHLNPKSKPVYSSLKKTYNIYLLKFLWSGRGLAAEWFSCWSHPGSLQSVGTSAGPVGFTHRPQVSSLLIRTPGSSPMWPLWQLDWTFSCHGGANSVCVTSPISIGQSKSHIHD